MTTREEWVEFFNLNPEDAIIMFEYCKYKGKPELDISKLIMLAMQGRLLEYGYNIHTFALEAYNNLAIELGFIELRDKSGTLLKIY